MESISKFTRSTFFQKCWNLSESVKTQCRKSICWTVWSKVSLRNSTSILYHNCSILVQNNVKNRLTWRPSLSHWWIVFQATWLTTTWTFKQFRTEATFTVCSKLTFRNWSRIPTLHKSRTRSIFTAPSFSSHLNATQPNTSMSMKSWRTQQTTVPKTNQPLMTIVKFTSASSWSILWIHLVM